MPPFDVFRHRLQDLLHTWHAQHARHQVLVVSSGGPIATATTLALQAPAAGMIELNLRLRNASLTEMVSVKDGWVLQTFNTLPQLQLPEQAGWITYA